MKLKTPLHLVAAGLALSAAVSLSTNAAGRLVVYCSACYQQMCGETKPLPKQKPKFSIMLKPPSFVMVQEVL